MKSIQTLRVCLRSFALITIYLCSGRYASATTETLFTTQIPQQLTVHDTNHELGTKFTTSLGGQIIAIRFWKSAKETGTHIGHIWSASGQLLAAVNFVNETASGWQQQSLPTPLALNPNTVYVVTVNTGNAYYVSTPYGLATKLVNNDLSSVVGTAGVTGAPGQFPTESYQASNYFRDVLFTPNTKAGLTSNPVNLSFANTNVGSSNSQTITLTNTGNGTLSISKVAVTGTGFSLSGITVPLSLAKGSQASLKVTFTPTVMGTATGSLTVTSNASNPILTVGLSGIGVTAKIAAVPASVAFGSVPIGVANTQTLTVSNSGNANLTISQTTAAGTGFSVTGPALPMTVAPSTSIALTVGFSPGTVGTTSGTVTIGSNATPSPLAVPLTGTGVTQSLTLSANPPALAFGNIAPGSSAKQSVTLTNAGNSSISLSALKAAGSYISVGGLALPVTLASGQTAAFSVTFAPTTTGTFTGSVSVTSTAANSPLSIPVSGTGAAPHYVTLSWTPSVSVVSGYDVYRGTTKGGPYTKITSSPVVGSTYNDATVQSGLTYYYVATSVSSNGTQSVFSSEISATIP
jgi:Domain of unknown function (DUF4082)/Abnormal spindle-like microcephaly-assoc'd, ASPM-SPD-2-Hydin